MKKVVIFCFLVHLGISLELLEKYGKGKVIVEISNGKIQGVAMKSREGLDFFGFTGISFAKPPVGDFRFKSPEPASDWPGVLNATTDAPICIQKCFMFNRSAGVEGQEDCLYLNVYTPTLKCRKLLPVIVHIHYGGFSAGNSRSTLIGPQYLLDKEVLYVSFNYRLGIFGFYTTLDDAAPGNYALKDQRLALRWVQANIVNFCGNPNLVTVIGMSAAAASVHHHLINPGSQGLFHRAIASSGSALNVWARNLDFLQEKLYKPVAQINACNGTTFEKVECMRRIDADDLINSIDRFRGFDNEPIVMFNVVKEKRSELNPEPFFQEDPVELIRKGKFAKIPFIIGLTENEGLVRAASKILNEDLYELLVNEFDEIMPGMVLPPFLKSENDLKAVWKEIKIFYINDRSISFEKPETIRGFIDLFSDLMFIFGIYQSVLWHAYNGYKDIWVYKFEYQGQQSFRQNFASTNRTVNFDFGVCHGDDYIYLFPAPEVLPGLPSSDLKMSEIMVEIYTYFAIHGVPPNIKNVLDKNPLKNDYLYFLNITNSGSSNINCPALMKMQSGFNTRLKERMDFWKKLPFKFQINLLN